MHKDVLLYHGSKGGLLGDTILPNSRKICDFGSGFYMGTQPSQAKALISVDIKPVLYHVRFMLSEIPEDRILTLNGLDWAYFVTYNRGKLEMLKNTPLYERISKIDEGKDVIIGPIADDSMREAMRRFTENELTDIAFLKCISSLNLGNQYVAKTPFACSKIKILSSRELVAGELQTALELSNQIYRDGSKLTRQFMAQYRRQGKYLDEIVAEEQERIQHETIMEKSNNEYDY